MVSLWQTLLSPIRFVGPTLRAGHAFVAARLQSVRFWVFLFLAIIVVLVAYYAVADRYSPLTTDAYVQAFVVQIAPQVPGQVVRVHVKEGDRAAKGKLLFELDARPFEHKVALLEAKLVETVQQVAQMETQRAEAKAEHDRLSALANYARSVYEQEELIFKKESTTERKYLDALQKHKAAQAALARSAKKIEQVEQGLAARIGGEHALIAQVRAQLAEAKLNLDYTRVYAPTDCLITNLQLRDGAFAHVGQPVMACIDTDAWLIVANFRENSLERMQPGQPALVAFQGLPGRLLPARVTTIGWGVSQGQGTPSGQLPDVKNQSSWVPSSQRFQVRLTLDDPDAAPLRVGMTGSVSVYTESDDRLNPITAAIHHIISWIYYL